jgi:hypothetical protein
MSSTPDETGRAVPPYEGRRESADVDGPDDLRRDGVTVGGATGPVESAEQKAAADPSGGTGVTPADEQPAADTEDGEPGEASVGPAHHPGTARGEDAAEVDYDELGTGD